ncbi:MAG: DUF3880 domain-containing protein, partial [bacterium]
MRNRKYIAYSDIKDSIFAKNSFALAELNKPLVEALQAQQIHNKLHLFKDENDFVNGEYLVNNKYCVFYSKPPELQIPIFYDEWLNIKKPALLFGIGLGYGLKYLLNHSAIPKLYVYVRDKSLLKIALTLNDYASQILTERLVIVSQENLFTLADKVIEFILPEPLLFRENKVEYLTISRIIKTGRISTKRAVILSGTLFVLDCATTLFDQGWDVFEIDRALSTPQEVYQSVENLQPDLVFQINLQDEMQKFNQKRVVVEWEIDPMASPIPPVESGGTGKLFIFTHNPDRLLNFQENNYAHCEYLPLCSNPHKFSPTKLDADSQKRFHCDLSFVGSLMFKTQQDLFAVLLDALDKQSREENEGWSKIGAWMQQLISNPPAGCKNSTLLTELKNLLQVSELPDSVRIH